MLAEARFYLQRGALQEAAAALAECRAKAPQDPGVVALSSQLIEAKAALEHESEIHPPYAPEVPPSPEPKASAAAATAMVDDPEVQQTLARIRRLDDQYQLPPSKIEQPLQATVIVDSPALPAEQTKSEAVEDTPSATAPSRSEEESRTIAFPTVAEEHATERRLAVASKALTISTLVAVLIVGASC